MEAKTTFQFERETPTPMDLCKVLACITQVIDEWQRDESKNNWHVEKASQWLKDAFIAQVTLKHCINVLMDDADPEKFMAADAMVVYGLQGVICDLQGMIKSLLTEEIDLIKVEDDNRDGESASSDEKGFSGVH